MIAKPTETEAIVAWNRRASDNKDAEIERLKENIKALENDNYNAETNLSRMTDLVEQPQKAQRWIPVEERLPKRDKRAINYSVDVLVLTEYDEVFSTYYSFGAPEGVVPIGWMDSNNYITHWMPLPSPPEKGADPE